MLILLFIQLLIKSKIIKVPVKLLIRDKSLAIIYLPFQEKFLQFPKRMIIDPHKKRQIY